MAIKNEHFNENASLRQGSGKIAVSKVNNIKFAMSRCLRQGTMTHNCI